MATFYDIYQNYLQNPYSGVNALPGVNPSSGIMNTNTISPIGGDSMGVSPVASISTNPNVTNTTPGTGIMGTNVNFSDIAKAIGFAMNPALGIANLAATQVLGKSPMDMAMEAMGISGFGRTDSDFATAGVFGGDDSSSTGTANATDTGDMGSEAANDAASASAAAGGSGGGGGADSAGDGGDGYATGGRIGYAEGGTGPSPDAAETYSEYKARMLEALRKSHGGQKTAYTDVQPDGSSSGISRDLPIEDYFNYMLADAYALGFNPNTGLKFGVDDRGVLTDQYKFKQEMADFKKNSQTTPTEDFSDYLNTTTINTNVQTTPIMGEPGGIITDGGLRYRINADGSRTLLDTAIEQTTPTVAEQIISTNNSSPALTSVAETLFPQGNFLNIKKTATSPTEYNIEATKDLVENLPGGTVKDIVAPTAAFALSLPYDAIQAYQRMEPGSGIQGFGKAFQAERPLESAFERFTGAAGPLAENINTAISSLNPFQKQQYMNYAVQNPDQAIAAAQRNKDFLAATQKNTNPATPAPASMADGGRVFYLQGGLASLLG
jgi:hypothetical protein